MDLCIECNSSLRSKVSIVSGMPITPTIQCKMCALSIHLNCHPTEGRLHVFVNLHRAHLTFVVTVIDINTHDFVAMKEQGKLIDYTCPTCIVMHLAIQ